MKLTALKIDPEFQGKIPPLTSEELDQLEKNIVSDGKVINPIIVWNGLIIDGHNRYAILQKHPDIPYTVHEKEFADRYEAIVWICKNQLGRRNLTVEQKNYLIGKQYEAEKQSDFNRGNQYTSSKKSGCYQNGNSQKQVEPVNELLPKWHRSKYRYSGGKIRQRRRCRRRSSSRYPPESPFRRGKTNSCRDCIRCSRTARRSSGTCRKNLQT